MLGKQNFLNVSKRMQEVSRVSFSDEELLETIEVLGCVYAFFSQQKENIISTAIGLRLSEMESYAFCRKWITVEGKWIVNKNFKRTLYDSERELYG